MYIVKLPSNLFIVSLRLVLSLVLTTSLQGCNPLNDRGANNPDQVVERYFLALERKDKDLRLFWV
jgi:hypothetical protein